MLVNKRYGARTGKFRALLSFIFFVFLTIPSISQDYEIFEKKSKKGIRQGKKTIVKPVYDSIKIKDEFVFTAYKSGTTYFVHSQKGTIKVIPYNEKHMPFFNGMGLFTQKGKWVIIDAFGASVTYQAYDSLVLLGNNVYLIGSTKLYGTGGNVVLESIKNIQPLTPEFIEIQTEEPESVRKLFHTKTVYTPYYYLFSITSGKIIYQSEFPWKITGRYVYGKPKNEIKSLLIQSDGTVFASQEFEQAENIGPFTLLKRKYVDVEYVQLLHEKLGSILLDTGKVMLRRNRNANLCWVNKSKRRLLFFNEEGMQTRTDMLASIWMDSLFMVARNKMGTLINADEEIIVSGIEDFEWVGKDMLKVFSGHNYRYYNTSEKTYVSKTYPILYGYKSQVRPMTTSDKISHALSAIFAAPVYPLIAYKDRKNRTRVSEGIIFDGDYPSSIGVYMTIEPQWKGKSIKRDSVWIATFKDPLVPLKYNFINTKGKTIFSSSFDYASSFGNDTVTSAKRNNQWYLIYADGKEVVIKNVVEMIPSTEYNLIWVKTKDNMEGYLKLDGSYAFPPKYTDIGSVGSKVYGRLHYEQVELDLSPYKKSK